MIIFSNVSFTYKRSGVLIVSILIIISVIADPYLNRSNAENPFYSDNIIKLVFISDNHLLGGWVLIALVQCSTILFKISLLSQRLYITPTKITVYIKISASVRKYIKS